MTTWTKRLKVALRLLLVGVVVTGCRIIGQLLIPAGEQTVLEPSAFAENGTMPLAFTIYGVLAYSLIGGVIFAGSGSFAWW